MYTPRAPAARPSSARHTPRRPTTATLAKDRRRRASGPAARAVDLQPSAAQVAPATISATLERPCDAARAALFDGDTARARRLYALSGASGLCDRYRLISESRAPDLVEQLHDFTAASDWGGAVRVVSALESLFSESLRWRAVCRAVRGVLLVLQRQVRAGIAEAFAANAAHPCAATGAYRVAALVLAPCWTAALLPWVQSELATSDTFADVLAAALGSRRPAMRVGVLQLRLPTGGTTVASVVERLTAPVALAEAKDAITFLDDMRTALGVAVAALRASHRLEARRAADAAEAELTACVASAQQALRRAHSAAFGCCGADDDDHHRVLGVRRGAPRGEIAKAYRRAAAQWHPDSCRLLRGAPCDATDRALATEKFLQIRAAYDALCAL